MGIIQVTPRIAIDEGELDEKFVLASGPGGQNVNKVSTAVQLRFDVRNSRALPNDVAIRLMKLAGSRLTQDGVLLLTSQRFRSQERNREDVRQKLVELILEAVPPPVKRRVTKPTLASKTRRLEAKGARSTIKRNRGAPRDD